MAVKATKSFRDGFMAQVKSPEYRVEEIELGDEKLRFKVRKLSFREAGKFQKENEKGKLDLIDQFFLLIQWGVFTDIDGTPLFEQTDKDTIKDSEMSDAVTKLFLSFAKTEDGEDISKN